MVARCGTESLIQPQRRQAAEIRPGALYSQCLRVSVVKESRTESRPTPNPTFAFKLENELRRKLN